MVDKSDYPHLGDEYEVYEKSDDNVYGSGPHGEFALDPMAGTEEPQDGRCGAVLKYTMERYGETRYCGGLPVGRFGNTQYEHDDYCKHHQRDKYLMDRAIELVEHGGFGQNYVVFEQALDPLEFILMAEMFSGLMEQSRHEFEPETYVREIDASDSDLIEEDTVSVQMPIPTAEQFKFQANELFHAALDEVKVNRMQEAVFTKGISEKQLADSADMDGKITDTKYELTENHLHLPISRLTKDIKEHLKNGGVAIGDDEDGGVLTFQRNDYTLDINPDEEDEDAKEMEDTVGETLDFELGD